MKAVDVRKTEQLGMNPSTASNRLVKDLLYSFVVETGRDSCFRCGNKVNRETFSIEHKEHWLDSENPVKLFFDLDNIAFSHLSCNVAAGRNRPPAKCGSHSSYENGCRCEKCKSFMSAYNVGRYNPEKRNERYRRLGK